MRRRSLVFFGALALGVLLLGCAGGETAPSSDIESTLAVCQRGFYIPAICKPEPPLSRFAVRDAAQPRQGVRGYAYVVWGTAGAARDIVARFADGTAHAALMKAGRDLARKFGEPPFRLFVVELPVTAACAAVTVAGDRPHATERIPPQTKYCERT